jgi:hypothetical protein
VETLLLVIATGLYAAGLCYVPPTVFQSADYLLYFKPAFHFLAESVRAGALPLWNPYAGLGRPFLADTQNAVCYPPTYLICFGQELGLFLLTWLHGALAVMGMRRLGSVLGIGRWQSYLMGLSYLASGALIARWATGQIGYCWALCYLPWLLYHAVRTQEPWQGRRLGLYAGCLALQFLCGHPQVFWFSAIGQAAFILASTVRLPLRETLRDLGQRFGQFGVSCVWCAGLVAIALLPMLQLAHESNRAESTAAFTNSYNMRWVDLLSLVVPRWKGLVWENNLLVGVVVALTGVMGLYRVRERNVRGLLAMLGIGLLLALGDNTPLFGLFYKWLPGYAGFRFQARAALLAVMALICAEGIWLSRPHPCLRAVWDYLSRIPVLYVVLALVILQIFELLQGAWMTKRFVTPTCSLVLDVPVEHSLELVLMDELQNDNLIKPFQPPPRVCVPRTVVSANHGMLYHYASLDAGGSLFLRRPWDYLHEMLGLTPPIEKGSLSPQVYEHGPFPYDDLSLLVGKPPKDPWFAIRGQPSPRAFIVYAAQCEDYDTVLDRLANGHDIRQCALLETSLNEPLPQTNGLGPSPAVFERFEPNELIVDFDAQTNALLVLAETWYPGWRAEIDGKPSICVSANTWMRAVPVSPGKHRAHLYFRQDYLLAGFFISLSSLGLVVGVVTWRGRCAEPSAPGRPEAIRRPAQPRVGQKHSSKRQPTPQVRRQGSLSGYLPLLRALAFSGALAFAGLLVYAEVQLVKWFRGQEAGTEANVEVRIGDVLYRQYQRDKAMPHFIESLRLAEQACRLTEYSDPVQFCTLAIAYDATGSHDKAMNVAKQGRDLAIAKGQGALADVFQEQINAIAARKPQGDMPR